MFKRYRKYKNKKTEYNGVIYDSKLEARIAQELDVAQAQGDIKKIKRQVKAKLYGQGGTFICAHQVDFVVLRVSTGKWEAHEAKGPITPSWRLKLKLFLDNYPDVEYHTHFDDWVCVGKLTRKPGASRRKKRAKRNTEVGSESEADHEEAETSSDSIGGRERRDRLHAEV